VKVHVVLVRTEYSANIGAAARAMANMGGDRLILIDPHGEAGAAEARRMAAGAAKRLKTITVYKDWDEFYGREGDGARIALTRRGGKRRKVLPLEKALEAVAGAPPKSSGATGPIYLIFGPEADGLDGGDLAFAGFVCHLPVYGPFGSLNLAQAVLLALFITRSRFKPDRSAPQVKGRRPKTVQPFYFPDALIKEWLETMGFDLSARRSSAYLTLRRLFLQNLPTRHEIQVIEAVLRQNIRKLRAATSLGLAAEQMADDLGDIAVEDV
jgi:tRNA/rRNA methyltransferase